MAADSDADPGVDLGAVVAFVLTLDPSHGVRVSSSAKEFLGSVRAMDEQSFGVLVSALENCWG